jgi:hypothetical protein
LSGRCVKSGQEADAFGDILTVGGSKVSVLQPIAILLAVMPAEI